jgi:hypothetical protein
MKAFLFGLLNAFSGTMENNYSEFKKHGEITAKINRKRNEQFN